jgi:hypothetical protein
MHDAETLIAALHRDWGEAQANYDEFRFFTGMRPSEEIALVLSDVDLASGIVSVNMARVAGIDRYKTKTGEDRRVQLCPRALSVLKRQLRLRPRLEAAGKINRDHVFFQKTGERFRNLQYPGIRWRKGRHVHHAPSSESVRDASDRLSPSRGRSVAAPICTGLQQSRRPKYRADRQSPGRSRRWESIANSRVRSFRMNSLIFNPSTPRTVACAEVP